MVGFEAKTQLWKVAATGGVPVPICRVPRGFTAAGSATWLPDDRIVFTTGNSGLLEVSALGGEPRPFLDLDVEKDADFHDAVVARGDAEIGFQQISDLLPIQASTSSVQLPSEVPRVTVFSAGIAARSPHPDSARALITLLASLGAAGVIATSGMDPITPR